MQATFSNRASIDNYLSRPNPSVLNNLRNKIRQIEQDYDLAKDLPDQEETIISLGDKKIDRSLPWQGIPSTALHEIFGDTAAIGFALTIINKILQKKSDMPILWCQRKYDLSGHGLAEYGLDPNKLILIQGKSDTDILWAMEEGLRSSSVAVVVGLPYKISPIAGRRLQLATEENQIPSLLIRTQNHKENQKSMIPTNAALTRWHVTSAPSITPAIGFGLGVPKWNLELQRYRFTTFNLKKRIQKQQKIAGRVTSWQVEWCHETCDLSVVTDLCNGSAPSQQKKQKTI